MASEEPQASRGKAGWRGAARGRGGLPQKPLGGWAQKKDYGPQQAILWRRVKVAAWSLLSAALIVGFIVKLLFTPTRTPLVAVVLTDYDDPFPPNAWAREDFANLSRLDREEVLKCSEIAWESKEQGLRELCRRLDGAKPGGPGKDTVILYLSMHGAVDAEGGPCLLPPGASPSDRSQWLSVRELLQRLFLEKRPGKLADRVHTLLVLDANRFDTAWPLGVLYNGFADRLPGVVEDARVPNLAVLNSAGPGQIGHPAPELRGSVFGYFFCRGLRGAADEESWGNRDRRVGVQELYRYLKAHVGQWVAENRADVQQPMLLPETADFPLAFAASKPTPPAAPLQPHRDPRWAEVAALWKKD